MVVLYFNPEDLIKITEKEGARDRTRWMTNQEFDEEMK